LTNIISTPVGNSSVAWADFDDDGDLDILLSGQKSYSEDTNYISTIYRNDGNDIFTELTGLGLTGVSMCSVASGDYDNDGDLDILLSGNSDNNPTTKIYRNEGNFIFNEHTNMGIQDVEYCSVAWGDYDNDGDLDFLLAGRIVNDKFSKIYRNEITPEENTPPLAPVNLNHTYINDTLTISWDNATDDLTPQNGLSYNCIIGTSSLGCQKVSPMSDISTGWRKVVDHGNTNQNTFWKYTNLDDGIYYWSVQAIDHCYLGSPFADEEIFIITSHQKMISFDHINIYPNPTKGKIMIETENKLKIIKIEIVDLNGRIIYLSKKYNSPINLSKQPKGIYFVKVITEEGVAIEKVVLQ